MTRTEVKARQEKIAGDAMLPTICLDLRQALNGAADPWPDEEVASVVQLLRDVVATWQSSVHSDDIEMDKAVWLLVKATIAYAEQRLAREV